MLIGYRLYSSLQQRNLILPPYQISPPSSECTEVKMEPNLDPQTGLIGPDAATDEDRQLDMDGADWNDLSPVLHALHDGGAPHVPT